MRQLIKAKNLPDAVLMLEKQTYIFIISVYEKSTKKIIDLEEFTTKKRAESFFEKTYLSYKQIDSSDFAHSNN